MRQRALLFKRTYRFQWSLSNQKEAFVRILINSFGFKCKPLGIGVENRYYVKRIGSKPDFAVLDNNKVIAYIEVTGGNLNIQPGDELWVQKAKLKKFYKLRKKAKIFFVYLGFYDYKLSIARYCEYEDLYPYCENPRDIRQVDIRGIPELYIATPYSLWKPLSRLRIELAKLAGDNAWV